jgi:hypothetical protein
MPNVVGDEMRDMTAKVNGGGKLRRDHCRARTDGGEDDDDGEDLLTDESKMLEQIMSTLYKMKLRVEKDSRARCKWSSVLRHLARHAFASLSFGYLIISTIQTANMQHKTPHHFQPAA